MNCGKTKVLIVEDDSGFRRGLVKLFEKAECHTTDVSGAEEALDSISKDTPDFILSDLKMPGIDGIELLRRIRAMEIDIPFVLLTAHLDDHTSEEALEAGADLAISKPVSVKGLHDLIERFSR